MKSRYEEKKKQKNKAKKKRFHVFEDKLDVDHYYLVVRKDHIIFLFRFLIFVKTISLDLFPLNNTWNTEPLKMPRFLGLGALAPYFFGPGVLEP